MSEFWKSVSIGGVFRCCVESVAEWALQQEKEGHEFKVGDCFTCPYCRFKLILMENGWEAVFDE